MGQPSDLRTKVYSAPSNRGFVTTNSKRREVFRWPDRGTHTETIAQLSASQTFGRAVELTLNPGLSGPWPQLAQVAARFRKYRVLSLSFRLRSTCPTTTTGESVSYIDYSVYPQAPASFLQAANQTNPTKAVLWKDGVFDGDIKSMMSGLSMKNVRTDQTEPPSLVDYDLGTYFVQAGGSIPGSGLDGVPEWCNLEVTYAFEFYDPATKLTGPGRITGSYSSYNTSVEVTEADDTVVQVQPGFTPVTPNFINSLSESTTGNGENTSTDDIVGNGSAWEVMSDGEYRLTCAVGQTGYGNQDTIADDNTVCDIYPFINGVGILSGRNQNFANWTQIATDVMTTMRTVSDIVFPLARGSLVLWKMFNTLGNSDYQAWQRYNYVTADINREGFFIEEV